MNLVPTGDISSRCLRNAHAMAILSCSAIQGLLLQGPDLSLEVIQVGGTVGALGGKVSHVSLELGKSAREHGANPLKLIQRLPDSIFVFFSLLAQFLQFL